MNYDYIDTLDDVSKARYIEKVSLVGLLECPYRIRKCEWTDDPTKWPQITNMDIVQYLIQSPCKFF